MPYYLFEVGRTARQRVKVHGDNVDQARKAAIDRMDKSMPISERPRVWHARLIEQASGCTQDGARLDEIAAIIEAVDARCMAADGPVTPTLAEMRQSEISRVYALATRKQPPRRKNP